MMHQVEVSINDDPVIAGLWRVLRNHDNELKFYLNFENDGKYGELTDDWYIESVTNTRIELVSESGDGTVEVLVFEKGM